MIERCRALFVVVFSAAAMLATTSFVSASHTPRVDLRATGDPYDAIGFEHLDPAIPTPRSILSHDIGERFTRHADMINYLRALDDASDRLVMEEYGRSIQGRPLVTLTITSPQNHERLEEILENNESMTWADRELGPQAPRLAREGQPAIVWFSFGVHGNEGSCMETAIQLAYMLSAAKGQEIDTLLRDLVIIIDPSLNPDGQMRYVSWFQNTRGATPDPHPDSAEHSEPWPGGRSNHYLFDLNRDWSWLVHPESESRVRKYTGIRPQVHVDFHEQGADSPHFFGDGDTPYNLNIPESTRKWLSRYTDALAQAFDQFGLVYSTRERFDYLYPGYGKVTPVYHGAMSVLNEQGGHSRGGLALEVEPGYTLTLAERVRNQLIVAHTYLQTTQQLRAQQLERYEQFFHDVRHDDNQHIYFISADNDPALLAKVWKLADAQGFRIETLNQDLSSDAIHSYETGQPVENLTLPAGTWVIRTSQPLGLFIKTMFEREPEIEDPDTYDITAWSLPIVYGLDAWYATTPLHHIPATTRLDRWTPPATSIQGHGDVALIVPADQYHFPHALSRAAQHGLRSRLAGESINIHDLTIPPGSLIVHIQSNDPDAVAAFEQDILDANLSAHRLAGALSNSGPVLGANANRRFVHPRIALVRGEPTSSLDFGATWHLLDVEQRIGHSIVHAHQLARIDLNHFNVLILPHSWGSIDRSLGERAVAEINDWIRDGGTLVAVGSSAEWATTTILEIKPEDQPTPDDANEQQQRPELSDLTYQQREQRAVEDRIPGALLRVDADTTHPLMFGVRPWLGALMRSSRTLPVSDSGYVLARFASEPRIAGVISERNTQRLAEKPYMTMHRHGTGVVVCIADEVATRGFTHATQRLLLNAATLGPSMTRAHQPLGHETD